jgi:GTP pyrophosphokinase
MPALGVHSVASTPKLAGTSLPGPGPDELTAVLGYLKPQDVEQIEQAYEVARAAHSGQYRQSGEPYITHPLAVAKILAEWHLDPQALMAALLHDVVEDTPRPKSEIAKRFGKAVASWSTASPRSTASSSRRCSTRRPRTSARCCSRWRATFE